MAEPDDDAAFAVFELRGARYDALGMPAENLAEISAYRSAIYKIARRIWLDRNGRSRVPDGFPEAFDLRLVKINEGSARPLLVLDRAASKASAAELDEWTGIFSEARDLLTGAVAGAGGDGTLPSNFPRSEVGVVKRIGASLYDDEQITLGSPEATGKRANLDEGVRKVLRKIDEEVPDEPPLQTVEGVITEFDGAKHTFQLRPNTTSRVVPCQLYNTDRALAEVVKHALAPDGITAPDVAVTGMAQIIKGSDTIKSLLVRDVRVVLPLREKLMRSQVELMNALEDGWLGPSSLAPRAGPMAQMEDLLPLLADDDGPMIKVLPSADGHVVLEWRRETLECSADIEPDNVMFLCADDTTTDALLEEHLPFDIEVLLRFVRTGSWQ